MEQPEQEHYATNESASTDKPTGRFLFVFWTVQELSVLVSAVLASAWVAGAKTAYALILGLIFDIVAELGGSSLTPGETLSHISQWCLVLTGLGGLKAVGAMFFMGLWIVHGELRAKMVRRHLLWSIMGKEMAWFDACHEGMASIVAGLQTYAGCPSADVGVPY